MGLKADTIWTHDFHKIKHNFQISGRVGSTKSNMDYPPDKAFQISNSNSQLYGCLRLSSSFPSLSFPHKLLLVYCKLKRQPQWPQYLISWRRCWCWWHRLGCWRCNLLTPTACTRRARTQPCSATTASLSESPLLPGLPFSTTETAAAASYLLATAGCPSDPPALRLLLSDRRLMRFLSSPSILHLSLRWVAFGSLHLLSSSICTVRCWLDLVFSLCEFEVFGDAVSV